MDQESLLDELENHSFEKPVAIFKHSTRCSISSVAKRRLERSWDLPKEEIDVYYLDLIRYRSISNQIASQFAVKHESPQLILLKDGKVVHHSSHNMIDVDGIKAALVK
ncbi:MAG: bacillithiol system redox-active protein YtxJ [Saprospiraceae bacterium]|nr:bacillithiol system redox-active protein YtxJ [Saprospiraceae bacterium]